MLSLLGEGGSTTPCCRYLFIENHLAVKSLLFPGSLESMIVVVWRERVYPRLVWASSVHSRPFHHGCSVVCRAQECFVVCVSVACCPTCPS
jgi:hypothetical protein